MNSESQTSAGGKPQKRTLEQVISDLCRVQGPDKTICPTDAAKAFAAERGEDDLGWRKWLQQVRSTAVGMTRKGELVIYRKGKPADPDTFRGVYRLGLPRSD
ncbi:MAG: DUF3253 domain-containing protein [Beijerinckiaceae bacterium]